MEDLKNYQVQMKEALIGRKDEIEEERLPEIKSLFSKFQSSFNAIYLILLNKKILTEDPYAYDTKISEITIPDSSPFTEAEKIDKISIRLSSLNLQLDFLLNYFQFSLNFINFARIKNLAGLIKYIDWIKFSEASSQINTRALYVMVNNLKTGSDKITTEVISDSLKQLNSLSKTLLSSLKVIMQFLKEEYMNDLRQKINIPEGLYTNSENKHAAIFKLIKQQFTKKSLGIQFYPSLIQEMIKDDFSKESESLHQEKLKAITVLSKKEKTVDNTALYRKLLLEGIRIASSSNLSMESALNKLRENVTLLDSKPITFGMKLKKWIHSAFFKKKKQEDRIFAIEIFDYSTSTTKITQLNFTSFITKSTRLINLLTNYANKMSQKYKTLQELDEEGLYKVLAVIIEDINKTSIKMDAMDTYFKTEIEKEIKPRIKGIQSDLISIKGSVSKAKDIRINYISKKEEEEQFKKLGIKVN